MDAVIPRGENWSTSGAIQTIPSQSQVLPAMLLENALCPLDLGLKMSRAPRPQRLTHWKALRALARPGFLRSTTRLSRVRNPAALSGGRSSGSHFCSAQLIPWRNACACPVTPPPFTVAIMLKPPSRPVTCAHAPCAHRLQAYVPRDTVQHFNFNFQQQ